MLPEILAQAAEPVAAATAAVGITGSIARLGAVAGALAVGMIGYKAVESVGRNPQAANKIQTLAIIAMALAEGVAILSLLLG